MIYLSGCVSPDALADDRLGLMLTPRMRNRVDLSVKVWAGDNGCFRQPWSFDGSRYVAWLRDYQRWRATCRFVVAPDVPYDAAATWTRSRPWFDMIRGLGYPAAFAAQDGVLDMPNTPIEWDAFDVVFIAGSTDWKFGLEACAVMAAARSRGKPIHIARVNSLRRLRAASEVGAATCDGTFLAFGPKTNIVRLHGWMHEMSARPSLWPCD